jgi:hypothetical protein
MYLCLCLCMYVFVLVSMYVRDREDICACECVCMYLFVRAGMYLACVYVCLSGGIHMCLCVRTYEAECEKSLRFESDAQKAAQFGQKVVCNVSVGSVCMYL